MQGRANYEEALELVMDATAAQRRSGSFRTMSVHDAVNAAATEAPLQVSDITDMRYENVDDAQYFYGRLDDIQCFL